MSITKTCHNTRIPIQLAAGEVRCEDGHMLCDSATKCLRSIDRSGGDKSQPFARDQAMERGKRTPSCRALLKAIT